MAVRFISIDLSGQLDLRVLLQVVLQRCFAHRRFALVWFVVDVWFGLADEYADLINDSTEPINLEGVAVVAAVHAWPPCSDCCSFFSLTLSPSSLSLKKGYYIEDVQGANKSHPFKSYEIAPGHVTRFWTNPKTHKGSKEKGEKF